MVKLNRTFVPNVTDRSTSTRGREGGQRHGGDDRDRRRAEGVEDGRDSSASRGIGRRVSAGFPLCGAVRPHGRADVARRGRSRLIPRSPSASTGSSIVHFWGEGIRSAIHAQTFRVEMPGLGPDDAFYVWSVRRGGRHVPTRRSSRAERRTAGEDGGERNLVDLTECEFSDSSAIRALACSREGDEFRPTTGEKPRRGRSSDPDPPHLGDGNRQSPPIERRSSRPRPR